MEIPTAVITAVFQFTNALGGGYTKRHTPRKETGLFTHTKGEYTTGLTCVMITFNVTT